MFQNLRYYLRRLWWAQFSGHTTLTTLIVWSNVLVFANQLLWLFYYRSEWFTNTFALSHAGLQQDRYWQLLTYGWLHSEFLPIHILFNLFMVFLLGRELEWPLGKWRFAILYAGGVLSAGLVWLFWDPDLQQPVAGASGAVFALLAAYATYEPKRVMRVWLFFVIPLRMSAGTMALVMIGFEALCQLLHWLPGIAHSAHLGGAFFGYVIMKIWRIRSGTIYPDYARITRL